MFITVVAWTIIELVRYPYYMLNTVHINFYPLLWLRYTLWIPLYPIGTCEYCVSFSEAF